MCELLVGLGEVELVGIEDVAGGPLRVMMSSRTVRPPCGVCGGVVWSEGERPTGLVDLPVFGWSVRLWWRKYAR